MIAVELLKLTRRLRTWLSIGLICALPLVVAIFIAVTHLAPPPGQGSAFLSAVLDDGQLYPAAALALVLPVFLPVAVAVVAGDSIAGEASAGTLRYLLAAPGGTHQAAGRQAGGDHRLHDAGRHRRHGHLLRHRRAHPRPVPRGGRGHRARWPVPGSIAPGVGGAPTAGLQAGAAITSLSGTPLTMFQLVERVLGAMAFITVSMLGVAAIALFLSTISSSALSAALGSLADPRRPARSSSP